MKLTHRTDKLLWGREVWDWAAERRLVSVTYWLVCTVAISGLSLNVNKLPVSAWNGLAAPKPSSQVAISYSGRVSISGSIWACGATLIPRPVGPSVRVTYKCDHGWGRLRTGTLARTRHYGRRIGLGRWGLWRPGMGVTNDQKNKV